MNETLVAHQLIVDHTESACGLQNVVVNKMQLVSAAGEWQHHHLYLAQQKQEKHEKEEWHEKRKL